MNIPDTNPYDGPSAFPSHGSMGEVCHHGMMLRDWFAGQALAGIAAEFTRMAAAKEIEVSEYLRGLKACGQSAYQIADAMLAERDRVQP